MLKIKNKKGFTLIETMMYTAFMAIVVSSFVGFALNIKIFRFRLMLMHQASLELDSSLNLMAKNIREAEEVLSPGVDATSSLLILKMKTGPNVSFELVDGQIYFESGLDSAYLTSKNLATDKLIFKLIMNQDQKGVDIKMEHGNSRSENERYNYITKRETYVNVRN